jgi:hypothetical protein
MSHSQDLRQAVKARFHPFVESRGFVRGKSTSLFTVFRRRDGESLHVFDIQWDKYGAPRFVINFGEVSLRNLRVEEPELGIHHCEKLGRLTRKKGPYLRSWFQLRKPWLEAIASLQRQYEPEEVVDQLLAFFPEVEAWWSDQAEGPHLNFLPRTGSEAPQVHVEHAVRFVGEQDGHVEREIKELWKSIFLKTPSVERAYLALITYEKSSTPQPALCIQHSEGGNQALVNSVSDPFRKIFNTSAGLEILFLNPEQETQVRRVCKPFYEAA